MARDMGELRPELPPHLTYHAIERYQQRVENVPFEVVVDRLSTDFILAAIEFGTSVIKLPNGHRLRVVDGCIVSTLPKRFHR